jgi:uncharacterized protein
MKISKYTKLIKYQNNFYIYNSISNFFAKIDDSLYEYLKNKQNKNELVPKDDFDDESIWLILTKNLLISENELDDFMLFSSTIKSRRNISNSLMLTITPTMDCNFNCYYCFETKNKSKIDTKLEENIVNWINNYIESKNIHYINITWFGGEPLLAPHVIENITKEILKFEKIKLGASIITNGYYLTKENLLLLKECKISSIQLSIDGIYESHNSKRFSKDDKKTFDTILKNIDVFNELDLDIVLNIRVSIDKNNIDKFDEVLDFFSSRYPNSKKINITPAFIIESTKHNCIESCISNKIEKFNFYKNLSQKMKNNSFVYPANNVNECAIRNQHSWVIDSLGDVYKCWETIANLEYKVGEIKEDGLIITNEKILNRYLYGSDPFEDSKCKNCFSFPICTGGCPHKRIENEFNNQLNDFCSNFNEDIESYLILTAQIKNEKN